MRTPEEALEIVGNRIDASTLEEYIAREWLRPASGVEGWYFEEIDLARLRLVCHLTQEIKVNDDGIDVVLSLLDQLYGLRADMQKLAQAVAQQPSQIQVEIMMTIKKLSSAE